MTEAHDADAVPLCRGKHVPSATSVDDGERWTGEEPSKLLIPLSDPPVMRL